MPCRKRFVTWSPTVTIAKFTEGVVELGLQPIGKLRHDANLRFEFLFRDAKQFTGLSDCQARCQKALHFHFNASMLALNLIKLQDRQHASLSEARVISVASWKIRKFNEHLLKRFSDMLGLDFSSIKSNPAYEALRNYGTIAA
jgi:hypothetical protein